MPELPEVETIRQTLKKLVVGETVKDVKVYWERIIKAPSVSHFKERLVGQTIRDIQRRGKFLIFEFDQDVLVSHLRMEGKYYVKPKATPLEKHTHIVFHLLSEKQLRYNDVRKFGTMHVFQKGEEHQNKPLNQLGPEPFDKKFTIDYFTRHLQKTRRQIKAVLLDQTIIAGLGNIYVDETLFQAGVHPARRANTLTEREIDRIKYFAKKTLQKAIEVGGTTIRSYVDGTGKMGMFQQELFVYGQEDQPCIQCQKPIIKTKVSGRGTHLCLHCQPLKEK